MEIELILYYCDAIPIVRTRFIASIYIGHDESCPYMHTTKKNSAEVFNPDGNKLNELNKVRTRLIASLHASYSLTGRTEQPRLREV